MNCIDIRTMLETESPSHQRGAVVQWQDTRFGRGPPAFNPRGRRELLGVKTWLSTLEIVNLSVFRMRQ